MILGGFLDEHLLWKCNIQTLATKTMVTLHAQDISILQIIHKQQNTLNLTILALWESAFMLNRKVPNSNITDVLGQDLVANLALRILVNSVSQTKQIQWMIMLEMHLSSCQKLPLMQLSNWYKKVFHENK